MKIKILALTLVVVMVSCNNTIPSKKKTISDYKVQVDKIRTFSKEHNYNQNIAFMIDYRMHSRLKRFYIVDLKNNTFLNKGLVCHGSCKGSNDSDYAKKFSNVNEIHCTSLGMALVGKRDYSKWGKKYKYWLKGLEDNNSNMEDRVVVLHAWSGVSDDVIYPKSLAFSFGCPTVSINFLDELDGILKKNKNVLLHSFY